MTHGEMDVCLTRMLQDANKQISVYAEVAYQLPGTVEERTKQLFTYWTQANIKLGRHYQINAAEAVLVLAFLHLIARATQSNE